MLPLRSVHHAEIGCCRGPAARDGSGSGARRRQSVVGSRQSAVEIASRGSKPSDDAEVGGRQSKVRSRISGVKRWLISPFCVAFGFFIIGAPALAQDQWIQRPQGSVDANLAGPAPLIPRPSPLLLVPHAAWPCRSPMATCRRSIHMRQSRSPPIARIGGPKGSTTFGISKGIARSRKVRCTPRETRPYFGSSMAGGSVFRRTRRSPISKET